MNATECIAGALARIGVLAESELPTAEQLRDGIVILNDMLDTWTLDGPHRWRRTEVTVPVVIGTASYVLPSTVARVMTVRHRETATGYELPMTEWMPDDFERMPIRTMTGRPTIYVVDRQLTQTTVTVWPVPDQAAELRVSVERTPTVVTTGTDVVDVPREWREVTKTTLGVRFADEYQIVNDVVGRLRERAAALYAQGQGFDREAVVRFVVRRRK